MRGRRILLTAPGVFLLMGLPGLVSSTDADGTPAESERVAQFQDWMKRLKE